MIGLAAARRFLPDLDDPRIDEPASALSDDLLANRALLAMPAGFQAQSDAATPVRTDQPPLGRPVADPSPVERLIEAKLRAAGVDVPHQ